MEGRIHLNGCRLTLAPGSRIKGEVEELYGDLQTVTLGSYWGLTVETRNS